MEKRIFRLRDGYKRVLQTGFILSLFFHIVLLQSYKRIVRVAASPRFSLDEIVLEEVKPVKVDTPKQPPRLPAVPMLSEDPTLPESVTHDPIGLGIDDGLILDPPEPAWEQAEIFIPVSDLPVPVGGWAAFAKHFYYPEIASKSGIEGTVHVIAYIDKSGRVVKTEIQKSVPGCDEAAETTIRNTLWIPAAQRGEQVAVKVVIPVKFQLH